MIYHSIDEQPRWSNDEIYLLIKYVIQLKDKTPKRLVIGSLLHAITDPSLLNNTLDLLRDSKETKGIDNSYKELLAQLTASSEYNLTDLYRIKAIYYSICFQYEYLISVNKAIDKTSAFELSIEVIDRDVLSNLDVLEKSFSFSARNHLLEHINRIPSQRGKIEAYNRSITAMSQLDYKFDTDSFDKEIQVLERLKNSVPQQVEIQAEKELPFYVEVGQFFYDGSIYKSKYIFHFRDEQFATIAELSKHVKKLLNTSKSVRQYINDTLSGSGEKNFFDPYKTERLDNIIKYCKHNNIKASEEFSAKYEMLKKMHR